MAGIVLALGAAWPVPAARLVQEEPPLRVAVSILPQAYFVERVGGPHVAVTVLVGGGQSPHTYEPTPRQITELASARLLFRVGVDFENTLLPRLERLFKDLRIVDTRRGVPLRYFSSAESEHDHGAGEAHEPDHAHEAGRPDPHIWLNPLFVKIQAQTIADALIEVDPKHADTYRRNLAAFHADLDQVHERLRQVLAPLRGREVFVYHPAFGYFTDAYGLKQVPVEVEGKEPTARQLRALVERARSSGVKVIFVQPQFSQKTAQALAEAIGGAVVPLDDLSRDYLANLANMAGLIQSKINAGTTTGPATQPGAANDGGKGAREGGQSSALPAAGQEKRAAGAKK